jgi:hypothetical protein
MEAFLYHFDLATARYGHTEVVDQLCAASDQLTTYAMKTLKYRCSCRNRLPLGLRHGLDFEGGLIQQRRGRDIEDGCERNQESDPDTRMICNPSH